MYLATASFVGAQYVPRLLCGWVFGLHIVKVAGEVALGFNAMIDMVDCWG
jgi:hypothetical protein